MKNKFIWEEEKIYFIKKDNMNLYNFLNFFEIRHGSYFSSVFERLYNYFFKNATNLFEDFETYYKHEYSNFKEYLSEKHSLFDDEIELLDNKHSHYKDLKYEVGIGIDTLMQDDTISKLFSKYLNGG